MANMPNFYVQIFSMTDHAKAFDRYQGPYTGVNASLQASEFREGLIYISTNTKTPRGEELDRKEFEKAKVILAYRHTDTGELYGTSEMLIPIEKAPWTDMPGIEVQAVSPTQIAIKLFTQVVTLETEKVVRVHFMKTIVYMKYFGEASGIEWSDTEVLEGPGKLHALPIDEDLTIAPPSGSSIQVKMGQETTQ